MAVLGGTHRSSLSMLGGWTVAVRNSISRNRQLSLNDRALHNFVRKSVGSLVWFSLMLERGGLFLIPFCKDLYLVELVLEDLD